ncbi:MAG TPA: helicase-related protein [Vicinamibacterales bacterium]|nr:helicase-related protein [Vicinamibacterales bacterium]
MPIPYEDGALLECRGETWRLSRSQRFDTCAILTLEGRDRSNAGDRLHVIDPFDRLRVVSGRKMRRRPRRVVTASALAAIVCARRSTSLWTAAASSIDLWPYQLEPALAVVRGAARLLLADAVGLGKTIQAGLILSELRERGWVEHALIVCPAGLRATWAHELRERFNITATVLDQSSIAERLAALPPGVSPWSGHAVAITSIDFVKRPEILSAIDNEPIDLIIADEAHHLAPGTDRGAAISRLASRSPWCVFVSATPHSGDRAAFDYLTSLGAAGDPIAIFRRRRGDVGLAVTRRSHVLGVRTTDEEALLLAGIEHYARAIWIARGREDHSVRLIAMTMARRAASSTAAITRTLHRRLALLTDVAIEPAQPPLPWEEGDDADDVDADAVLGARGLNDAAEERAALNHLITLAGCCGTSSKIRRLHRLLDLAREPVVVFTEYRDTLDAVVASFRTSPRRVTSIHGGVPTDLRRDAVDAFNNGRADILVATDAAGEGLNLHQRCRLVIDMELPWNPLRLEQRVGRVDRLGQLRTVHAIRMFHADTIEGAVLEHLRIRHRRAEDALDRPINEGAVAAAIFEGKPVERVFADISSVAIWPAAEEAGRLEAQRRLGQLPRVSTNAWTPGRRHSRWLRTLHRSAIVNEAGHLVSEHLLASTIALGRHPENLRQWRLLFAELEAILPRPRFEGVPQGQALERRIAAIRTRLRRDRTPRYQRSLFDRRADAEAAARQAVIDRLDAALSRALNAVASPIRPDARLDLIAAWPEPRR